MAIRVSVLFLSILTMVCLFFSTTSSFAAESKVVKGKVFSINQSNFGHWKAYIANGMGCIKPGVVAGLHSPPYKKVYFTNPENKTYMLWQVDKPHVMASIYKNVGPVCFKFVPKGSKTILGYSCKVVNGMDAAGRNRVRYYFSKKPEVPFSWKLSLSKTMRYPVRYGLPFRIDVRDKIGATWLWRTVFKVEKIEDVTLKKNIFKLPSDYKKVNSIAALVFSQGGKLNKSDIEDLFEHHFDGK